MNSVNIRSDLLNSVYSGIVRNSVFRPNILPIFIAMVAALFLINYGGLYSFLNLVSAAPLNPGYTVAYPSYVIPSALSLVALEFFLFFYLLSLGLEAERRIETKSKMRWGDLVVVAAFKYPKFLVASVFQLFVFIGGIVLFVIPGFYLGTKMVFFSVLNHGQDFTFTDALKESTDTVRGSFVKCLLLLVIYFVIAAVLIYASLAFNIPLAIKILLLSILVPFIYMSFLFSSDALYKIIKAQSTYKRPPFMASMLSNPI
jgi:hypothetical protein